MIYGNSFSLDTAFSVENGWRGVRNIYAFIAFLLCLGYISG